MTEYFVPDGYGEAEIVEKRSRFIARIWRTETEEEALAHINAMRQLHWDATHNVYAYIIRDGGIMRYSDDGEPSGTSGMPTLNVLRGRELQNVCCVVTRYFGGTLLGTGGLVRAYGAAAAAAVDQAGIAVVRLWKRLVLSCGYGQFEKVKKLTEDRGGIVADTDFGADVMLTVLMPETETERYCAAMLDQTAGTVEPMEDGEELRAVRIGG